CVSECSRRAAPNCRPAACAPQNLSEESPGVGALCIRDLLRCPSGYDFAALVSRLWSEIDDPVGTFNHFEIVLDHDRRMASVDEPLEQPQQHRDVIEMQARR